MNVDKFLEAASAAIEQQIIPALFTPAQIAEMHQPFHHKWDYYSLSHMVTAEKEFAAFGGACPQLAVNDPRITEAQIDALPPTITVAYEGKNYAVPLRVYLDTDESVKEWQENVEFNSRSREALASIEPGLASKFHLAASKDYSIGYGIGQVGGKPSATFLVQLFSDKAQKLGSKVKKYMESELKTLTPERPSEVILSGPIRLH
jgi:hypothetical protein